MTTRNKWLENEETSISCCHYYLEVVVLITGERHAQLLFYFMNSSGCRFTNLTGHYFNETGTGLGKGVIVICSNYPRHRKEPRIEILSKDSSDWGIMQQVEEGRINIDKPRWDQGTYTGRLSHFFVTTNPLNILCTSDELERAKDIVTRYRRGEKVDLPEDEIWRAKHIYDSAFHPDTGEKMILIGRMAAQVPMCMLIGGCMLSFYKTPREVIFWQWFNQSFNAVVNYTNRSGSSPVSVPQLGFSYVCATTGALAAALSLNRLVKKSPPLIGRFVPYAAIAVANCINIPLMRMKELTDGIPVVDENDNEIGKSKKAAQTGITAVTISRVAMAAPAFVLPPFFMNHLEKKGFLKRFPWSSAPIQTLLCGLCYTFATPMCCALFPQKASISVSKLEPELQERIKKLPKPLTEVYYNKGL